MSMPRMVLAALLAITAAAALMYVGSTDATAKDESEEAVCLVAPVGKTAKDFAEGVAQTINDHRTAGRTGGTMSVPWGSGSMSPHVICAW